MPVSETKNGEKRSHREHNRLKHSTTEKSNIFHRLEVRSEIHDSRAKNFPTRRVPSVCEACSIGLRGVPLDTSEHSVSKPAENSVNKKSSRSNTSYTVPAPYAEGRPDRPGTHRPGPSYRVKRSIINKKSKEMLVGSEKSCTFARRLLSNGAKTAPKCV